MTRIELRNLIHEAVIVGSVKEIELRINKVVDEIFEKEQFALCEEMITTFLHVHESLKNVTNYPADFDVVRKLSPILDHCYKMVMKYRGNKE